MHLVYKVEEDTSITGDITDQMNALLDFYKNFSERVNFNEVWRYRIVEEGATTSTTTTTTESAIDSTPSKLSPSLTYQLPSVTTATPLTSTNNTDNTNITLNTSNTNSNNNSTTSTNTNDHYNHNIQPMEIDNTSSKASCTEIIRLDITAINSDNPDTAPPTPPYNSPQSIITDARSQTPSKSTDDTSSGSVSKNSAKTVPITRSQKIRLSLLHYLPKNLTSAQSSSFLDELMNKIQNVWLPPEKRVKSGLPGTGSLTGDYPNRKDENEAESDDSSDGVEVEAGDDEERPKKRGRPPKSKKKLGRGRGRPRKSEQ